MRSGVTLRDAAAADEAALLRVFRAAGQAAWAHILPVEDLGSGPGPARWAAAVGDPQPRSRVLVAERSAQVVGFAYVRPSGDDDASPTTGELDGLYTHPDVWGDGVGRGLLAAALTSLADLGFAEATLWTAEENHRPRRIYERAGWRTDGASRRRTLFGAEFVELRYRIALSGTAAPGGFGQGSDPLEGG